MGKVERKCPSTGSVLTLTQLVKSTIQVGAVRDIRCLSGWAARREDEKAKRLYGGVVKKRVAGDLGRGTTVQTWCLFVLLAAGLSVICNAGAGHYHVINQAPNVRSFGVHDLPFD